MQSGFSQEFFLSLHQQQLQQFSHHASSVPLTPHPSGLQTSSLASVTTTPGLLALSGVLATQSQLAAKDERGPQDLGSHRGKGVALEDPSPSSL